MVSSLDVVGVRGAMRGAVLVRGVGVDARLGVGTDVRALRLRSGTKVAISTNLMPLALVFIYSGLLLLSRKMDTFIEISNR